MRIIKCDICKSQIAEEQVVPFAWPIHHGSRQGLKVELCGRCADMACEVIAAGYERLVELHEKPESK